MDSLHLKFPVKASDLKLRFSFISDVQYFEFSLALNGKYWELLCNDYDVGFHENLTGPF